MAIPGFDGTGIYTRHYSWRADETNAIGIVSDRHDVEDDEFAKGLNLAFLRDGQAVATGHFKMGNYKITGLGAATADNDAVSLAQLTGSTPSGIPNFQKALNLVGIGTAGRLNFMGLTGVQGIGWAGGDLSWVVKIGVANQYTNRLALNDKFDATGNDVAWFEDNGNLRIPAILSNLSIDPAGQLRVPAAGWGTELRFDTHQMVLAGIDTATSGGGYLIPAGGLQDRIEFQAYGGSAGINLHKKSGAGFTNVLRGYTGAAGTGLRWQMQLGNGTVEAGDNSGSDFSLNCYNNSGTLISSVIVGYRKTGKVQFPGGVTGVTDFESLITAVNINNDNAGDALLLGGKGGVYIRPQGTGVTTNQTFFNTAGDIIVGRYVDANGYAERNGISGSAGGSYFNFNYVPGLQAWVDNTNLGTVAFTCDYRAKDNIKPLSSTWEKVKALRPVQFTWRDWATQWRDDDGQHETVLSRKSDDVEWGFLAHELQETLLPSAASGTKDAPDVVQSPNLPAIIAALTAALQEAQLRIEALEAKLA